MPEPPPRPTDDSLRKTFGIGSPPAEQPAAGDSVRGGDDQRLYVGRGPGEFYFKVVGESFHQDALKRLYAAWNFGTTTGRILIEREPDNPYDANAVAVLTSDREIIGHFPRAEAARYAPVLDHLSKAHRGFYCHGRLTGGGDLHVGIVLDMKSAKELQPARVSPPAPRSSPPTHRRQEHGQPAAAINHKKRAERDVTEILGIVKGLLADGVVNDEELQFLIDWGRQHPDSVRRWPGSALFARIQHVFEDGVIDEQERADLADLMSQLVGGKISMVLGADGPTTLPVDDPAPPLEWNESVFVMTGRFAYGTRAACEQEIVSRGGQLAANVTKRTTYLVLGTFGSDDWSHSSFGRKLERACELKSAGGEIYIITEDHWAGAL